MKYVLLAVLIIAACAPVRVQTIRPDEFTRYAIPRRVVISGSDDSVNTRRLVGELNDRFARAGFTVVRVQEVNAALAPRGLTLRFLLDRSDYRLIGEYAGVDAVVVARQFYGTELHFIDTATGAERASGCWRTTTISITNDIIDQIKGRKPSSLLCPVKTK